MKKNRANIDNKAPIVEKFRIINNSGIVTELLEEVVKRITKDMNLPCFNLVCKKPTHDGICITNVKRPLVIISVKNIEQFKDVLKHELVHLKQHQEDYASEDFNNKVTVTG